MTKYAYYVNCVSKKSILTTHFVRRDEWENMAKLPKSHHRHLERKVRSSQKAKRTIARTRTHIHSGSNI